MFFIVISLTEHLFQNGETKHFEHIECDWPVFYCFLIIDAVFKNNDQQLHYYQEILFNKLLRIDPVYGDYLIPKYFYVSVDKATQL